MVDFAHLSLIPLVPTSSSPKIKEIAFKTIPSASKVEIKRFLESFHGLQVQNVRTLNVKGKMRDRGRSLVAKPDYKKAYVTLKKPVSFSHYLCPFHTTTNAINNDNYNKNKNMLTNQC